MPLGEIRARRVRWSCGQALDTNQAKKKSQTSSGESLQNHTDKPCYLMNDKEDYAIGNL